MLLNLVILRPRHASTDTCSVAIKMVSAVALNEILDSYWCTNIPGESYVYVQALPATLRVTFACEHIQDDGTSNVLYLGRLEKAYRLDASEYQRSPPVYHIHN